jgi:DNA-binding MarR family transcriptional regulator
MSQEEDTWARLLTLFTHKRDALFGVLATYGLTPPHGHAVSLLMEGPARMRDLADRLGCDASYITALVDRLEEAGLAERRTSEHDRRVKVIALTPAGQAAARRIEAAISDPPPELRALTRAERRQLAALVVKAVPELDPTAHPLRPRARR